MDKRKFICLLKSKGFRYLRDGNSHEIWVNDNGHTFAVPHNKIIHTGLVWNFKRKFCK